MMFSRELDRLPDEPVRKILILRTAPTVQVRWAVEQLRGSYPDAAFTVVGTHLQSSDLFADMQKLELKSQWLTPRSFKPVSNAVKRENFDIAVMCLNSDCGAGYDRASRVMKKIPARFKLVAGYNKRWYAWDPRAFADGFFLLRVIVNSLQVLFFPAIVLYLLLMPSRPSYMPAGQGRPAPRYNR